MKKKLAIITPGFLPVPAIKGGAVEKLVEYIINANEIKKDFEIDLFSVANEKLNEYKYTKTNIYEIKITKFDRIISYFYDNICYVLNLEKVYNSFAKKCIKIVNKNSYDYILIENNMYLYEYIYKHINDKNSKFLFHLHNDIGKYDKPIKLCNLINDTAYKIMVVSNFMKKRFDFITKSDKAEILYNVIDFDKFYYSKEAYKELRNKYNLNNKYVFGYIGRMAEDKGVLELIKSFNKIKNENIYLLIIGDSLTDNINKYKNEIIKLLNNNIIFIPQIPNDEVYKYISMMDCVVIPTLCEEAFGLVALEALACKKNVIATKGGGVTELLNKSNSVLVSANNIEKELYDALKSMYKTKENNINVEFLKKKYSIENYFDNFYNIFEKGNDYNKKRVLTITFQRANNYGAQLQAFALQRKLQQKYESNILDYDNKNISNTYKIFNLKKLKIFNFIYTFIVDILKMKKEIKRKKNFNIFRRKMSYTRYYDNVNDFKQNIEEADCYIVGSDQMWNPNLTGGYDDVYFMNFNSKSKKITYAVSSNITRKSKIDNNFLEKMKKIDNISVREESLKKYIETNIGKKVKIVVDPVFLLTKEEWEKSLNLKKKIIDKKYIFVYSVSNANQLFYDTINYIANKENITIIYFDPFDTRNNFKCKKINGYKYGPEEFLNLLYNSEYVITTSFHALALSTIFNKKMFVIPTSNADRLYTTINLFDLKDFVIKEKSDIKKVTNLKHDWIKTNKLLEEKRKESINWLYTNIDK